jgi:hypothetical protein
LRQKSSVKVDHSQEATKQADGLGRRAVLKMGHSFFQRSGTLGGNFVSEEGDLGCFEDTFRRVD